MFYNFVIRLVHFLLLILNGRIHVQNKEKLPEGTTYVLAAPHRSWLDPVFIAIAAYPHTFTTMAKKELFDNKFVNFILRKMNAFPVDRANPGPSAIKHPVTVLKEGKMNFKYQVPHPFFFQEPVSALLEMQSFLFCDS